MKNRKIYINYLKVLLLLILLFNLLLIYVFIASTGTTNLYRLFKSLNFLNKEFFISDTSLLTLKKGYLKIILGDSKTPTYNRATFFGQVNGDIFYDNNIKSYVLPITIQSKNRNVGALIVMGNKNITKSVLLAKKGEVSYIQNWIGVKSDKISDYLNNKSPLIIQVYYQKDTSEFEKLKTCRDFCKTKLKEFRQYAKNLEDIFSKINTEKEIKTNQFIGLLDSLIIYVN